MSACGTCAQLGGVHGSGRRQRARRNLPTQRSENPKAAEAGFRLLPWLEWAHLHQIRMASGKLPECIRHRQRDGYSQSDEILHLRTRTTSWPVGTKNRKRKQLEERPWNSSPSGRPEVIRDSQSDVLHRCAEPLLHRTCEMQLWTITKFSVSFEIVDTYRSPTNEAPQR